mmetsp:Transcript_3733/g.10843  ORF Transcript_3733/g.10843 Transcript_3733/m.10843 type:complete len:570 (+) Transcript_3733:278-1987(+)|eukprot:CAMPEP_0176014038 /NCGR_PEP_ID=MMETSP0120_2-20121206/6614_1 /TAXON_ID=160619 /ORGANISM="Kryptoperidinium foliaceum, Strain CCMP 1326" /LENGTH=569 /DNA_ID=CAMNT_0017346961 /DNA_START=253 /DNA_END=1962 /DNA_ORIENTATION=+
MSTATASAAPAPKDAATLSPRPGTAGASIAQQQQPPATATRRSDGEIFSPTSAAALALSTLHHFGDSSSGGQRPKQRPEDLKGTRLFNQQGGGANAEGQEAPTEEAANARVKKDEGGNETEMAPTERPDESAAALPTGVMHYGVPYPPGAMYKPGAYAQWQRGDSSSHGAGTPPWQAAQYYAPYPGDASRGTSPSVVGPSPTNLPPQDPKEAAAAGYPNTTYLLQHPRASPTNAAGAMYPPPPGMMMEHHDKPYARAQSETAFVTPTPKKAKTSASADSAEKKKAAAYSRKKKSLGVLAENFLNAYKELPQGSTIVVDEAAVTLGVERRRIYDVVNILEAIQLVTKKHKNTYTWMGLEHLDVCFGKLQHEAMEDYPQDARAFLGVEPVGNRAPKQPPKGREFKSLAKLSQEFLQVFLVGHETLSLPEASDKIQGQTSVEELIAMGQGNSQEMDDKALKAAAARGLKTKIRRLYDIANVFLSVGLLRKVDSRDATRRPNFSWAWPTTPKEIYLKHTKKDLPQSDKSTNDRPHPTVTPAPSTSPSPTNNENAAAPAGDNNKASAAAVIESS